MVDSKWWRISRAVIPPAYRPMIIESSPSILRWPLRTRRGVNEPARSRGTSISKGPTWRVDGLGRGAVAGVAAGRCRRLSLLIAQVLGRLGPQAALQNLLEQSGEQPPGPGHLDISGVDLLEQAVQGPGLAQPPSHIAPVDGLVPLLSRSHRRQSFHQGLHRPLNTPSSGAPGPTRRWPPPGPDRPPGSPLSHPGRWRPRTGRGTRRGPGGGTRTP